MPKFRIDGEIYEAASPDQAYEQHASKYTPGMASGLLSQFNQGLTLGGADEISAAMSGNYDKSMRDQRLSREMFQAKHPYLSAGATAAGSLAPVAGSMLLAPETLGAAPAAAGGRALQMTMNALAGRAGGTALTIPQVMAQGAKAGVALGGPTGYLSADPESGGGRGQGAFEGALAGGVFGSALPAGIMSLEKLGAKAVPMLRRAADAFGIDHGPSVSRMAPAGPGPMDESMVPSGAEAAILKRLIDGGVSPVEAQQALAAAQRQGVPLGLIDVGGQGVQRLARGTRSIPGQGSAMIDDALTQRSAEQPGRVKRLLERALGRQMSGNGGRVSDELLQSARSDSNPFYSQLDSLPPLQNPEVLKLMQTPAVRKILQDLEQTRSVWERPVKPLYNADGSLARRPTFADLNDVTVSINEMLQPSFQRMGRPIDGVNLTTSEGRKGAQDLARKLRSLGDAEPGGSTWNTARASYAGPADARSNYESGLSFSQPGTSLRDVQAQLESGTPAQTKWYQRGVVEALRNDIDRMPDLNSQPNVLRNIAGNQNARDKLAAVTPPRRADDLAARIEMENQANRTRNFVQGGSQTADKSAEALDLASEVGQAASGGVKGIFSKAVSKMWNGLRSHVGEQTRVEIAKHLTNFSDPVAQQEFLARLARLQQAGELRADRVAAVAKGITVMEQTE